MVEPRYQEKITQIINSYAPTCSIYLYGSRARSTQQPGSDIDLALDNGAPIAANTLMHIRMDLDETTIPLTIDLVDVHTVDQKFLKIIKKDWVTWKTQK